MRQRAEYDDHDNPTALYAPGRDVPTTFSWGRTRSDEEEKQHLLRRSVSPLGIVTKVVYDTDDETDENPKGLPLESRLDNSSGTLFIAGKRPIRRIRTYNRRKSRRGGMEQWHYYCQVRLHP